MNFKALLKTYPAQILQLALLYIVTGKLGLILAVPPGYATVIWPPSGIALGMLLIMGWRLWPGVLAGSFILNCFVAGVYSPETGIVFANIITALTIAIGSTLQAVAGRYLMVRFIGMPLAIKGLADIVKIFLLIGPLACVIAPSIGISSLYFSGVLPADRVTDNWATWWLGDILGIIVFLPLVMVAPGRKERLSWRGNLVGTLPILSMLVILMPLGLTFYAWKIASELSYEKASTEFSNLAYDSERAIQHKISSYSNALIGAAGFLEGSENVTRVEWAKYAKAIDVKVSYPGINGIGFIYNIPSENLDEFLTKQKSMLPDFKVHPEIFNNKNYIITYIEPASENREAIGLNINFESNRSEAAEKARDVGKTTITKQIILVQDKQKTPGFLLLYPVYKNNQSLASIKERRAAIKGWVYAPFIARNFFKDLVNHDHRYSLRIYDGKSEDRNNLIFTSDEFDETHAPVFKTRKLLNIMQQEWLVVWESTPLYEKKSESNSPFFIMLGGILFTSMFGIFLIITSVRRTETIKIVSGERNYIIPSLVFISLSIGSYLLYTTLKERELNYIKTLVALEADKAEMMIKSEIDSKLLALSRIAKRWEVYGGTPYELWKEDARNHIKDMSGLKTLEWVDSSYRVKWAEPLEGNENAIGLNIIFDKKRQDALEGAAGKHFPTITQPLRLVQGYDAFIAYIPLYVKERFDGFIAGIFSTQNFFGAEVTSNLLSNYRMDIKYAGKEYFSNNVAVSLEQNGLQVHRSIEIYDKKWDLHITPTAEFVKGRQTFLPALVLIGGLIIAALSALTIRWALLAKLRYIYVEESSRALKVSEETFRLAMEHAPIGMALVSTKGRFVNVNPALCDLLGYTEEDLLSNDFQSITYPDDLEKDLEYVQKMLSGDIKSYEMEKRYYHSSGRIIWVLLNVSMVRNYMGDPDYFVSQIQDITERKEVDRIKNEFISVVSHELRTPLTAIHGSIGLIIGALSKDIPEKVGKLLEIARNNSERLMLLINDILDMDKIASGQMRFNMKTENIAEITRQAVVNNEPYAQKYNTEIKFQRMERDVKVKIDAERYLQVMSNLISNAAKFSGKGQEIIVFLDLIGQNVRISVQDFGAGIPKEFHTRIFGRFSQADSSKTRSKGGTGLGLHITKQIVEKMNGSIGFNSEVGHGSTFWIEFPVIE